MDSNYHQEQSATSSAAPDQKLAILLKPQDASLSPGPLPRAQPPSGSKTAVCQTTSFTRAKRTSVSGRNKVVFETQPWLVYALSSRWASYRARLDDCREHPSADSVHELRVAIRRLIAQVALFDYFRVGRSSQRVQRLLKRQLKSLGALRDGHVQRIFIDQQAVKFPELLVLQHHLDRQESKLIKAVSRQANQFRSRKLGRCIHGMVADLTQPNTSLRHDKLTALAIRRAEEAFAETVERKRLIDLADLTTIHRTRVAFKRFRYVVESLPYEVTGFSRRDLRQLAYYQRKMGNIQDLEVVQACITGFIARYAGADGLLAPFCAYLRMRRRRALRSFLKSADKLCQFWPPPALSEDRQPAANQRAA